MKINFLPAILLAWCLCAGHSQKAAAQTPTWAVTASPSNNWTSVAMSADGSRIVATSSLIYTSTNYGSTWVSNHVSAGSWQQVASSADGTKLVAAAGDVLTNSGINWSLAFAPPGGQLVDNIACSADGTKLVTGEFFLFSPLVLFTSANSGLTWVNETNSRAPWRAVASSADGSHLVATEGANGSTIYTSANSGALWISNNAPQLLWNALASSANGSNLLVNASGNYPSLYNSTNAGVTWSPVPNQPPGITKMACSTNGLTWFAAAGVNIFSTTDSGETWVTNDTPVIPFTTLTFSAIAVSADGTRGVVTAASGYIYTLQSGQPAYTLALTLAANKVSLLWPTNYDALGLGLENNTNLADTNWHAVTTTPTVTNANYRVTLPATNHQLYFRLAAP